MTLDPAAPFGRTLSGAPRKNILWDWAKWLAILEAEGKLVLYANVDYPNQYKKISALQVIAGQYVRERFRKRINFDVAESTITITFKGPTRRRSV